MEFKDYYKILGLEKTATPDDIKKAFRKLARKYHPDVSKEANASARMAEVNEANAVLSDPEKRTAYDELASQPPGRRGQQGQGFQPPPNWDGRGFEFRAAPGSNGPGEHSDFFEELFGRAQRGGASAGASSGRGGRMPPMPGDDQHARIELDLLDAYNGAERTLSLRGAEGDRQLEVKIPKGVREGQHIRLAGQGGPGFAGGAAGDLLLEVVFKPDTRWRAEGRDVYQRLPLAPWEAALGGSVAVHTPTGEAEVTVPAGFKPGKKLRLKGRGIPGKEPGDLYLELEIALPAGSGEPQLAAWAALRDAFPGFDARTEAGRS